MPKKHERMKNIPYTSVVRSLIYAQVCTKSNITFIIGMLDKYQSNLDFEHWKAVKKVMRQLQGTKDYVFIYK